MDNANPPVSVRVATKVDAISKVFLATVGIVAVTTLAGAFGALGANAAISLVGAPTLVVKLTTDTPRARTVQAPVQNLDLVHLAFTLQGRVAAVGIAKLTFNVQTDLANGRVTNVRLYDQNDRLLAGPVSVDEYHHTVTFNGPLAVKPSLKVKVKADVAPDPGNSRRLALAINPPTGIQVITPTANLKFSPTRPVVGKIMTIVQGATQQVGILDISASNSEAGANRDVNVVGGKSSGLIGAFKLNAKNEPVKIKKFSLFVEDDTNVLNNLASIQLIDSDKTTVLATTTNFTLGDYDGDHDGNNDILGSFDGWNYVVPASGVKTIFVRVVTKEIGDGPEQTGRAGTAMELQIAGQVGNLVAEGTASGQPIVLSAAAMPVNSNTTSEYDSDYTTNTATNYGVSVVSLTNDLPNGQLTNGAVIVGKFKFTIDSGNNTDDQGNPAEFNFEDVVFTFNYDSARVTVGGSGSDFYYYWASDPSTLMTVIDFSNGDTSDDVDLSSLAPILGTDTLVVKAANITGAGDAGDYFQVKLNSVNSTDFEWNDGTATGFYSLALPYSSVAGGVLSN